MSKVEVTLKIATSLDARIALADGTSQWITGPEARARSHDLRASHDAVLVGIGTVLADDPLLTARTIPLPDRQPARIVMDSHARTPSQGRLARSAGLGRIIIASSGNTNPSLTALGIETWNCGDQTGARVSPVEVLRRCEVEGLSSLMVEGGGQVAAAFLRSGLVNRLEWFRAPILIGGDGLPAIASLELGALSDSSRWQLVATERHGDDVLESYQAFDLV